jgi:hypothetical protein
MNDNNRENKLLKDLIQSGPVIPQPKRKIQINRDVSQVSQQAVSKEEVLVTLVKVDVNIELDPRDPFPNRTIEKIMDLTTETTVQSEQTTEVTTAVNEETAAVTENTQVQ